MKWFSNKKQIYDNAIFAEWFCRYFITLRYFHPRICCWNYFVIYQLFSEEFIIHKKKCFKWAHLSTRMFQMEYWNSLLLLSGFIFVSRDPIKNINLHTVQQLMQSYVWNSFLVTSSQLRYSAQSLGHANIWTASKNFTWTSNGNCLQAIYYTLCTIQHEFQSTKLCNFPRLCCEFHCWNMIPPQIFPQHKSIFSKLVFLILPLPKYKFKLTHIII